MLGVTACADDPPATEPTTGPTTGPTSGPATTITTDSTPIVAPNSGPETFETLPPAGSFSYPTEPDAVVLQISSKVESGPPVPLFTLYGDRRVVAGTTAGWFEGQVADGDVQLLLGEAESVGLLDSELSLRGPDPDVDPDLTVVLDVDGTRLQHEFDLSQIERPVALRAFLQDASVYNRFGLTDPFDPGQWLVCDAEGCEIATAPSSSADRPVLPGEDVGELVQG